jgi:hypothetical protein
MVGTTAWAHLTLPDQPAAMYQAAWTSLATDPYCSVAAAFFAAP